MRWRCGNSAGRCSSTAIRRPGSIRPSCRETASSPSSQGSAAGMALRDSSAVLISRTLAEIVDILRGCSRHFRCGRRLHRDPFQIGIFIAPGLGRPPTPGPAETSASLRPQPRQIIALIPEVRNILERRIVELHRGHQRRIHGVDDHRRPRPHRSEPLREARDSTAPSGPARCRNRISS